MYTYPASNNHNVIYDNDVLCGRGGATNNHKGNKFYRQLVNNHKSNYLVSSKVEKKRVAKFIIDTIRRGGGRFLKVTQPGNELVDIGDISAMEKTCQALREGLNLRNDKRKISSEEDMAASQLPFTETSSRSPNKITTTLIENTYPRGSYPMAFDQSSYYPYPRDYNINYSQPYNNIQRQQDYRYPQSGIQNNFEFNQQYYNYNDNSRQYVGRCTCKKTNCLKLYCQCFANSMYCSPNDCRCKDCYNSTYYNEMIHQARSKIAEKQNYSKLQRTAGETTNHLA